MYGRLRAYTYTQASKRVFSVQLSIGMYILKVSVRSTLAHHTYPRALGEERDSE